MLLSKDTLGRENVALSGQSGSAMVVCMLVLVVVTTLGILGVQTSITETSIATNEQRFEENFQHSEGGSGLEATHVGFARPGFFQWYEINDPDAWNQLLIPDDNANFDPGDDSGESSPRDKFTSATAQEQRTATELWPRQNLGMDAVDDELDFSYLVTFMGASTKMLKGYNASQFAAYQFRVNGAKRVVIEMGGIKIGVKSL